MVSILAATQSYEAWLGKRISLVPKHLHKKHGRMEEDPFVFLRGTFYRWAQQFPVLCPGLAQVPEILAVGDLHIENFGTWRDTEGRLVWGINDFDEAWTMPYTCDLVRLATSALLAIRNDRMELPVVEACGAIAAGYAEGLEEPAGAFVLADRHAWLRDIAVAGLCDWDDFWKGLRKELAKRFAATYPLPEEALRLLREALPEGSTPEQLGLRAAGVGSLGRLRFAAVTEWKGGRVAREIKQLAPSGWAWATGAETHAQHFASRFLESSVRCRDPFSRVVNGWSIRRLAPDGDKLTLDAVWEKRTHLETKRQKRARRQRDVERACRMLRDMGRETANVHRANSTELIAAVRAHLAGLPEGWLHAVAQRMATATEADWKSWRATAGRE